MSGQYILEGHTPVPVDDLISWGRWFQKANRQVAHDRVGDVRVSTVFLGLDHGYGDGPPVLFETMIFGGPHDQYQERYSTWEEALDGHLKALALVRKAQP